MKILYLGDVYAEPGIQLLESRLKALRQAQQVDLVIAQAENVSNGKGMLPADMQRLRAAGVDCFTGGNHTPRRPELTEYLTDPGQPVIGPANMPDCPGPGWKYVPSVKGPVLVVSILGQTVGHQPPTIQNPLKTIDQLLQSQESVKKVTTVVNFHGDFSSEKKIFGHYLDGAVGLVVGDHWHIQTSDAAILPQGTAYITDVGMCGTLHSSLGVTYDSVVPRWRDDQPTQNEVETKGPVQLNGVLATIDERTGLATAIQTIREIIEEA